MIVKATEHEFDWNNKDLLLAFNCINKYELPPRILDNPADYAEPEQSSDQVPGDKGCIIERSKKLIKQDGEASWIASFWINQKRLPAEVLPYEVDKQRQYYFCLAAGIVAEEEAKRVLRK